MSDLGVNALNLFLIFNIIFAIIIIFFEHNDPTVTWAWVLVLLFVPYFGFLIYLVVGLDGRKSRPYIIKSRKDKQLLDEIYDLDYEGLKFLHAHNNKVLLKEYLGILDSAKYESLVDLNYTTNKSPITLHNKVDVFFEGDDLFQKLIRDIEKATTYIHIQFYIFKSDNVGQKIIDAMIDASNRGVEVRLLSDKIGSRSKCLSKKQVKKMRENGVLVEFFPIPTTFSLNFRNHRKICIIDGTIGYVGGFNVGNEYTGISKRHGHWRDTHIRVKGDVVKMFEISFMKDWNYTTKTDKFSFLERYFPVCQINDLYISKIQFVTSGPDTKFMNIQLALAKLISTAENCVYIVTPYFVPDNGLLTAIVNAKLSGVKVTIVIPKNPDHAFVFGASLSYIAELIDIGVDCYAYDDGFVHSKLVVVDSSVTSVGSSNFDIRSFKLNFEDTAFVYSNYVAKIMEAKIEEDIKNSTKLTSSWYYNRSYVQKSKEALSRLLSPLL